MCQPCPALVLTCHSEEPSPAGGDASPTAVSTLGVPCLLGAGGPLDSVPALVTLSAATRSLGPFPQSLSLSCSARPPPTWALHHLDQFIGASRQVHCRLRSSLTKASVPLHVLFPLPGRLVPFFAQPLWLFSQSCG